MEVTKQEPVSCADTTDSLDLENPLQGNFYAVYIPIDVRQKEAQGCDYIFEDKMEAMKIVKKTKKARFKQFGCYHEALRFAAIGTVDLSKSDLMTNGVTKETLITSPVGPQMVGERLSPFKGPKPQDLVKLRKSIENGDDDYFQKAVWENPRFLVSSGDTPSILQEGFRYNALHVAAKAKNATLAESILSTISNPRFVRLLYGDDSDANVENRMQVLLDLYLNTPDKGLNETPLHFASKFGAADVVEVLVSFSQCDRTLKNKYGQTPDMIICDRCNVFADSLSEDKLAVVKRKISEHLENSFYVPVLRAEDNSVPPVIGEPFSPGGAPVVTADLLSPKLEIHAYAGPLSRENAEQFRRVWKTPPRTSTPIKRRIQDSSFESIASLKYTDTEKGLERLGHTLASKFDVNWKEFWSFLDCFVDIASADGLALLENHLAARIYSAEGSYPSSPDSPDENCNLNDESAERVGDISPFLYIEKACNVFANRLAHEIYNRLDDKFYTKVSLIELQVKQVELLILSYMDDSRFSKVNLSFLHSRLGQLTAQKISKLADTGLGRSDIYFLLSAFVNECTKAFDCFSSDDEANYPKDNKPTSSKKQLICLTQTILSHLNSDFQPANSELDDESVCRETWTSTKECNCVFHFKRTRKSLGLSRNSSLKHYKSSFKNEASRKLHFTEDDELKLGAFTDDSEDDFYTPPSSPIGPIESDDEFDEAPLLSEIFIEGPNPTKTDCDVFKALKYADCQIDPEKYPNIYRWFHNVNLYSDTQKESWPAPVREKPQEPASVFCTPTKHPPRPHQPHTHTSNSWLRITGANSPKSCSKRQN